MAFLTTVFYKNYLHSDSDIQRHNSTFYLLLCGFSRFTPLVTVRFCHHNARAAASDVTVTSTWNWSIALLFPWRRVMLFMWHTAATIALYDTWIAFISFFLFYSKYSQTCSLYYEISDIPILKYVQVNVFGSLDTFIMTVLVDLYRVMGAAMFCSRWIWAGGLTTRKFILSSRNTLK